MISEKKRLAQRRNFNKRCIVGMMGTCKRISNHERSISSKFEVSALNQVDALLKLVLLEWQGTVAEAIQK